MPNNGHQSTYGTDITDIRYSIHHTPYTIHHTPNTMEEISDTPSASTEQAQSDYYTLFCTLSVPYIYIHTYIHIYIHTYTHTHTHIHTHTHTHIHTICTSSGAISQYGDIQEAEVEIEVVEVVYRSKNRSRI
jgi:hypothetical protein